MAFFFVCAGLVVVAVLTGEFRERFRDRYKLVRCLRSGPSAAVCWGASIYVLTNWLVNRMSTPLDTVSPYLGGMLLYWMHLAPFAAGILTWRWFRWDQHMRLGEMPINHETIYYEESMDFRGSVFLLAITFVGTACEILWTTVSDTSSKASDVPVIASAIVTFVFIMGFAYRRNHTG